MISETYATYCDFLTFLVVMTAVTAAGVAVMVVIATSVAVTMVVIMVIAPDIGIESQFAGNQSLRCRVSTAADTAKELDACCCQGHLGATTDATADQHICIQIFQNAGQSAVAAAVGVDDLGSDDLAVCHIIDLKLLGVTEMLENLTVVVSYRDSHRKNSFRLCG